MANQAIDIFKEVLAEKPNDVNSMKQIAGIYFSIKNLDDAEDWQKKVLAVDPKDPEAAYTIGVIDWTKAHENKLKALQDAGLNDDGKGNVKAPKKVMEPLAQQNASAGRRRPEVSRPWPSTIAPTTTTPCVSEPDLPQQGGRGLRQRRRRDSGPGAGRGVDRRRQWAPARPTKRRRTRVPAASPWIPAARCIRSDGLQPVNTNGLCHQSRRPFFFAANPMAKFWSHLCSSTVRLACFSASLVSLPAPAQPRASAKPRWSPVPRPAAMQAVAILRPASSRTTIAKQLEVTVCGDSLIHVTARPINAPRRKRVPALDARQPPKPAPAPPSQFSRQAGFRGHAHHSTHRGFSFRCATAT